MDFEKDHQQENNDLQSVQNRGWQDGSGSVNPPTQNNNNVSPLPNDVNPVKENIPKMTAEEQVAQDRWRNSPEMNQGLQEILPKGNNQSDPQSTPLNLEKLRTEWQGEEQSEGNGIEYHEIDWSSIGKEAIVLKKGQKTSIYDIAKQLGWPEDKVTHAHIITYIREASTQNSKTKNIDKNYLIATEDATLSIPKFRAYANYCKKNPEPKFQKFYQEKLAQYGYPPLISGLEQKIETTIVNYTNPVTQIPSQVPVSQTLYGKWLMHRINEAKNFFDSHGTIEGFVYNLLDGQPQPINSELITDKNYGWYSKEAWANLDWNEKAKHFEEGLDERLQENEGGIRETFKQMQKNALANGEEINSQYTPNHTEEGEEIYSFRKKQIEDWEEDGTGNITNVNAKMKFLKKKINEEIKPKLAENPNKTNKELLTSQLSAYEQQLVAYQSIQAILKKWGNPNYTPTKTDIALLKEYKEHLKNATVGYYCPTLKSLQQLEKAIQNIIPTIQNASLDNTNKTNQLNELNQASGLLLRVQQSVKKCTKEKTIPTFEEFQQFKSAKAVEEKFKKYNSSLPTIYYTLVDSILQGDYLIQKHGTTKEPLIPDYIQHLKKEEKSHVFKRPSENE